MPMEKRTSCVIVKLKDNCQALQVKVHDEVHCKGLEDGAEM